LTENPSAINNQPSSSFFYHCDGNGNITALLGTNQVLVGKYLYDPYGNVLSMSGPLADANLCRFSSKEFHRNAGIYYYGFRFYDPSLQRWVNRDPIEERSGLNLYGFCGNRVIGCVDPIGLEALSVTFESADISPNSAKEYFNEPEDAIFIDRAQQILNNAKRLVGEKYDPKGKCGNCIADITFAAHGEGAGNFRMGDLVYSAPIYSSYLAAGNPYKKKYIDDVVKARGILAELAKLKCDNVKITVLSCGAGDDEPGALLREHVVEIFGPNATVLTYTGSCGFLFGVPRAAPFIPKKK